MSGVLSRPVTEDQSELEEWWKNVSLPVSIPIGIYQDWLNLRPYQRGLQLEDCDCAHLKLLDEIYRFGNDNEWVHQLLVGHNLIKKQVFCTNCGEEALYYPDIFTFRCGKSGKPGGAKSHKKKKKCNFWESAIKGGWFEGKVAIRENLLLIYYYLTSEVTQDWLHQVTGLSPTIIRDWENFIRFTCVCFAVENGNKIGGVGVTVQIDESKFGKSKYNRGRWVKGTWVFGGIEDEGGTGQFFMVPVLRRDQATLVAIIKEHILPGTTIISGNELR